MSSDTTLSVKEFNDKTKSLEHAVRRMVKAGKTVFCCGNYVYLYYGRVKSIFVCKFAFK